METTAHNSRPERRLVRGERGASLVEYALLVALIAVTCIVSVTFFGKSVSNNMSKTGSTIENPQ